ncbi:TPA: AraC family transcriptional regulator [Salmonella enterica subsp. enterica]|nr:AraC family transcriptional regulator [Salmonella enterica subsp. enterica]
MDIKAWLSCHSHAATSIFHIWRYCGEWKTSVHITGNASFHAILEGECLLTFENKRERILLSEGDIIFFFSNSPFYLLSSLTTTSDEHRAGETKPVNNTHVTDTTLLRGFLQPTNYQSELLFALMPEYLLIRPESDGNLRLQKFFDLLKIECWQTEAECALTITRLIDLLLVYIVEEILDEHLVDVNLLLASKSEKLSALIMSIIHSPAEKWSVGEMANLMNMSRSTFIRRVQEICNYSPNELTTRLRINIAGNLLRRGCKVCDTSQRVGYDSVTGFYNAFRKVTRMSPSEFIKAIQINELKKR